MNGDELDKRSAYCAADWPARHAKCRPVPLREVGVSGYLGQRIDRNLSSVLAGVACPVVRGFEARAEGKPLSNREAYYRLAADSDLYKWMEGASYIYARTGGRSLKEAVDRIAALILKCQQDDGYINTQAPHKKRFDQKVCHDLYIAGHFFEAAAAHHRATGERNLLNAARRWADCLIREFENGHPYFEQAALREHSEYELGLLRLYRATGEKKYLDFSITLTNKLNKVGPRVADVKAGGGLHAVRVGYLLAGMADLYLETGDKEMLRHLPGLWDELVDTRMYVTGGMDSHTESIAEEPYDLPHTNDVNPDRTVGETCGSIAMIMFSWRMHAITGRSRCFDVIENTLYNNVLGALSLDGMGHFYYNPMRVVADQSKRTDHWHRPATARCMLPKINRTACCLPNCWRFLGALPEYVFSFDRDGLFVNLYTSAAVNHALVNGRRIALSVETEYPHKGDVTVRFDGEKSTPFNLRLRVPGWCKAATAEWPGQKETRVEGGDYLAIDRTWNKGDTVHLRFDMPVRMMLPDSRVKANAGQVVFARGPVLFCLEQEDVSFPVEEASVAVQPEDVIRRVRVQWHPELLDGIHVLHLPGLASGKRVGLTLVPWSVRANRSQNSRWLIFLPLAKTPK